MVDRENEIIWQNGGTGHCNAYLGIGLQKATAAVALSNLPPDHRIPATVWIYSIVSDFSCLERFKVRKVVLLHDGKRKDVGWGIRVEWLGSRRGCLRATPHLKRFY